MPEAPRKIATGRTCVVGGDLTRTRRARDGPHHRGLSTIGVPAILQAGKSHPIDAPIANLGIVPEGRAHYRYSGSLTTPPCTEGVMWLILKETGSVSKEQVATFVKMIGEDARGPQPLNGRLVVH
jgi:carbonic anhydrase